MTKCNRWQVKQYASEQSFEDFYNPMYLAEIKHENSKLLIIQALKICALKTVLLVEIK